MMTSIQADFRRPKSPRQSWLKRHLQACHNGIFILGQEPVRTLLAILLLSLLFLLPTGLWLLDKNIQAISHNAQSSPKIIVYLTPGTKEQQALDLQEQIKQRPDVQDVLYISPFQGLKELVRQLGFSELFAKLPVNPIPSVIVVSPANSLTSATEVENLANVLRTLPQVGSLQLNLELVKQQYAYLTLWKQIYYGLGSLLLLAIFLSLLNIMQIFFLIQQSSGKMDYSARSLFYSGIFLSVLSAMIATALLMIFCGFFADNLQLLANLKIVSLTGEMITKVIAGALFLGFICTWLAAKFCSKID